MTGLLTQYLGAGNKADRPTRPNIVNGALALYHAEDTKEIFKWNSDLDPVAPETQSGGWELFVVSDTPIDGIAYLRQDGKWVAYEAPTNGIPDAPAGKLYGRTQGEWREIVIPAPPTPEVGEAPEDGKAYVRKDGTWSQQIDEVGIPEAPKDGEQYVRKDGAWSKVQGVPGSGDGTAPVKATIENLALLTARLTDTTQKLQVGFVKINLSVTSDLSGGWDAGDSSFLIAEDGDYLCIGLVRVTDDSPLASHGVGVGTIAGDNANFLWANTNTGLPTENRNGLLNTFISRFSKGDRVFLFGYGGTVLSLSQASLSIKRLPSSVVTSVSGGGGGEGSRKRPEIIQFKGIRNDGVVRLPNPPTPGNLLVWVATGYGVQDINYRPAGFFRAARFISNNNNSCTVDIGEIITASTPQEYNVSAGDNQQGVLYEIQDLDWIYPGSGGYTPYDGVDFTVSNPPSPFQSDALVLFAFGHDTTAMFALKPNQPGVVADFIGSSEGGNINHTGLIGHVEEGNPRTIRGNMVNGGPTDGVYGIFWALGSK